MGSDMEYNIGEKIEIKLQQLHGYVTAIKMLQGPVYNYIINFTIAKRLQNAMLCIKSFKNILKYLTIV